MSARTTEKQLLVEVPAAIAGLLDVPERDVKVQAGSGPDVGVDLFVKAAGHTFAVEVLAAASPGVVADHAKTVASISQRLRRKVTPLLAVPYMTDAGRRACEQARIPWFDLSGNAHIVAPGIRIIVEGRPNRFRTPGRPASVFAPKSARVARWLLMHEGRALTQREIARGTDMTEGFVSRIVSRLEHDSYVLREPSGAVRVRDPGLLLDAWRDEYRFDKHTLVQGHVAARSGDALARSVSDALSVASVEHAATGLAAAWQMTHFAAFRIATFFLAAPLPKGLKEKLSFREEARGANLWLVVPDDIGVFHGAEPRDGVRCVHPVQAYVDLKAHPERATEAAERLRAELLARKRNG
jgi:hypothetical protein